MFTKKPIPGGRIDFLQRSIESDQSPKPKKNSKIWIRMAIYAAVFLFMVILMFSNRVLIETENIFRAGEGGIFSQLKNLFIKDSDDITGAKDNRINVLILGIGGPEHEGPNLTDTIIIASIQPNKSDTAEITDSKNGRAALLSIPRDMYAESAVHGNAKINSFYAFGQERGRRGGELMKQIIEEEFDIPIHYYVRIDFNGFIEFIDALGGIDVYVDREFTDYQFPAPNYKTKTVSFEKGLQRFDGLTALQFARSRHGTNGEGSDFARARRQQKIILAVKDKLIRKKTLLSPAKIKRTAEALGSTIETNMELWEAIKFADIIKTIDTETVIQRVLDDAPGGPLKTATGSKGSFLLIPKDENVLPRIARDIFETDGVHGENPRVVIKNGTEVSGFAKTTQSELEALGVIVLRVENAEKQTYAQTIIFDLARGSKPQTRALLEQKLRGNVSPYVPVDIWQKAHDADFVIILGKRDE